MVKQYVNTTISLVVCLEKTWCLWKLVLEGLQLVNYNEVVEGGLREMDGKL